MYIIKTNFVISIYNKILKVSRKLKIYNTQKNMRKFGYFNQKN